MIVEPHAAFIAASGMRPGERIEWHEELKTVVGYVIGPDGEIVVRDGKLQSFVYLK